MKTEMTLADKGILINAIISYFRENIKKKNQKLTAYNLWSDQEKFDEGDLFFKLAFMADEDVKKIASLILG